MTDRRRRAPVARLVAFFVLSLAGGGAVRAEIIAEIGPAAGLGWTDNATASTEQGMRKRPDEFTTLIGTAAVIRLLKAHG